MASLKTPVCNFGLPAIDFALRDTDGKLWTREDCRGKNGLLVMFICNHCPYVRAILDRLIRDTSALKQFGVHAVAIMANDPVQYPEDSFANMIKVAKHYCFPFPYLFDETQQTARAYGAVCTPDFFGYNRDLHLQYRGRLDVSGKAASADARRDLFEAMKQIARSGRGPEKQLSSIGCSIKWRAA